MGGGGSSTRKIDQQIIDANEYENNADLIKNVPETFKMFRNYGNNDNNSNGILIFLFLIFILIMFYLYFKYSYK